MASINKVVLIGNLGADPEVRALPSGDAVANFSVATSDRRSNGKGGYVEVTEWHRIALYGKQAEVAGKYLRKGSQVYVEGKLRTSVWTDRNGVERKAWGVIADRMQMLGKPEIRTLDERLSVENEMGWLDSAMPPTLVSGPGTAQSAASADDNIQF